jgi:hypothetical protein
LLGFAALYPAYNGCVDWRGGKYFDSLSSGVTQVLGAVRPEAVGRSAFNFVPARCRLLNPDPWSSPTTFSWAMAHSPTVPTPTVRGRLNSSVFDRLHEGVPDSATVPGLIQVAEPLRVQRYAGGPVQYVQCET